MYVITDCLMDNANTEAKERIATKLSDFDAQSQSLLLCLAQLGLGLAGFGGLISAFKPELEQKSLRVQGALQLLLEHAFALVLLALLPFLLHHFGLKCQHLWRFSSIFVIAFLLGEGSFQASRVVDFAGAGTQIGHPNLFVFGFIAPTMGFYLVAVYNLFSPGLSRYLLALYWILFAGMFQFYLLR